MTKAQFFGTDSKFIEFTEKEVGNRFFCYSDSNESDPFPEWAKNEGLTHRFIVIDNSYRYLKIAKTLAYIAVDEDDTGIVYEKWGISIKSVSNN